MATVKDDIVNFLSKEKQNVDKKELINFVEYLLSHKISIDDEQMVKVFCEFLYENLKGSALPKKFMTTYNVNYTRNREISFKMDKRICEDRFIMYSPEGKKQAHREMQVKKILNIDPSKHFAPKIMLESLIENKTKTVDAKAEEYTTFKEHFEQIYFNTCIYTVDEIINDPKLLDKFYL